MVRSPTINLHIVTFVTSFSSQVGSIDTNGYLDEMFARTHVIEGDSGGLW